MEEVRSALVPGALVWARGERWHVRLTRPLPRGAIVTLDAADAANPQRAATLLVPFDRIDPATDRPPARRRRDAVIRGTLHALSRARPERVLWAAPVARMDLLPWQLAPALAVLGGVTRLLLADAVGLGKTIQAGLVLAELRARGLVERALILVPAGLRPAWAAELKTRFELPVEILDLPAILELERSGAVGANPWNLTPLIVSSLDLVKRAEVLQAVELAPLDLLIVDEAHHATPGTDRHAAVSRLAGQVPWLVLASATPHSGDAAAYRALLALGAVGSPPVDRVCVFRRTHGEVRFSVARRTHILRVRLSVEEQRLHAAVLAYARELCRAPAGATPGVQLLAGVLARRASSSPWAIHRTLLRRLEGLAGARPMSTPAEPVLPWEELDEEESSEPPWLSVAGLVDAAAERERVRELVQLADTAGSRWSKGVRLQRLVRQLGEPLIVFSEFRDSLDACRELLEPMTSVVCLHGALDAAERHARLAAFVEGRARVLLATDVAGEGLNLHGPSRLVITLEWPWSPLRLEQRIGRVHRLGQTRTVHAIHLTARESYEDTVAAKVLGRAARAAADLSEAASRSARVVAAEVLGVALGPPMQDGPATPTVTPNAQVHGEAARIARLRGWASLGRPLPAGAPSWARPRRGPGTGRVVAVFEVLRAVSGSPRSSHVVPIEIRLQTAPADRREWRLMCRRIAADHRIRQAAIDATSQAPPDHPWTGVCARLAAIREARQAITSPAVQPSLFDRRALREARGHASGRAQWDEWQARLEDACRDGTHRPAVTTRMLAILPIGEHPS